MSRITLHITIREEVGVTEAEIAMVQFICSLGEKVKSVRFIRDQYGVDLQRAIAIVNAILE